MTGGAGSGVRREGVRRLFARGGNPYAGADLPNGRRMLALLWVLSSLLIAVFLPAAPPTEHLGTAGWVVAGALVLAGPIGARWLLDPKRSVHFDQLLAVSYAGVVQVALIAWLAAGDNAVYNGLMVLWACSGVGVHPPRRAVTFLAIVALAAAAPLLYGTGEDSTMDVLRDVLLTLAAGSAVLVLMVYVRAQRVGLRSGEATARQLALEDTLTGVGNRRAFDEALRSEMARTRRAASPLSLALLDLDGFKAINDREGHVEGDAHLRRFADAVRGSIRTGDRCFRWGGDELAVIFPDTPLDEAERVCARVAAAVRGSDSTRDGVPLGASYGVAELASDADPEQFVRAADSALMVRKDSKRHRQARFARSESAE